MGPEPINGHVEPWLGSLYTLTKGKLDTHLTKVGISNGLTFSSDYKKFYYTDTLTGRVDQFDYDIDTGSICKLVSFPSISTHKIVHLANRTPILTLEKHGIEGAPDGITIDADGNLWMAIFNGYKVIKFDPRKPETLLQTIDIPAKQVYAFKFF